MCGERRKLARMRPACCECETRVSKIYCSRLAKDALLFSSLGYVLTEEERESLQVEILRRRRRTATFRKRKNLTSFA